MDEAIALEFLSKIESGELPLEAVHDLDPRVQEIVADIALERALQEPIVFEPLSDAEMEPIRQAMEERRRWNLDYIVKGDFVAAHEPVDLQTLERFVFYLGENSTGISIIFDWQNNTVHYSPFTAVLYSNTSLSHLDPTAAIANDDLTTLIEAITESNLLQWDELYAGREDRFSTFSRAWSLGILFSDGTMLRRSGYGEFEDGLPPQEEWSTWISFVRSFGEEITERAKAEAEADQDE